MTSGEAENIHTSVLADEILDLAVAAMPTLVIDATLGMGGHTERLLEKFRDARVIGIDHDREAIEHAKRRLAQFGERVAVVKSNFESIAEIAKEHAKDGVDLIIADLGVSSLQFDSGERGFSFRFDADLDMRMDPESGGPTAADMLNELREEEIANIIYEFGEERKSRKIARWIVEKREAGTPIEKTGDLAALVQRAVGRGKKDAIHPATRTFQALRIAVNDELGVLERFLNDAIGVLKQNGILAVISFHSLEDRVVKQTFQKQSGRCFCPPRIPQCVCGAEKRVQILTKKPIIPGEDEMRANPRSRSAKLRAAKRLLPLK
ncbi:MAG: 16S rRNA (cytosine(1402)-N(4))-methyltransferase RsmH [Blastocatellia bacterium]|nr:16S rRNA (cytosine(1402)-N(4))-methyltransferase RsmH [Blastocatellia bacterium]